MAAMGIGFTAATIMLDRLLPRKEEPVMLYLRKLKRSGADMLGGSPLENPFTDEFNKMFLILVHILDYGVMKYVGTDITHLVEQEYRHAKMHHQGAKKEKETDPCRRWAPIVWLFDFLMLRCGRNFGAAIAGAVEASSGNAFYVSMLSPFVRNYPNDLVLFHFLEEMEHSELTVQNLRSKTYAFVRVFTFPVMMPLWFLFVLAPPLLHIVGHPWVLLRLKTYPQFVCYYLGFIPTLVAGLLGVVFHWVLPFSEAKVFTTWRYKYCGDLVAARGIEFDIEEKCAYPLRR